MIFFYVSLFYYIYTVINNKDNMNTDTKSLVQRLKEHLESPAGQKSM